MGGVKSNINISSVMVLLQKTAQRYKKIFNYTTRTRKNLRIVTKNLRIVTLLSPKRRIFHIGTKK